MNVSQVLELPSFADAQIIAGKDGLDHEVTTAMVLEATDISSWGKKGQLILTSYYALRNLDERGLEAFFEQMDKIGISGMVLKLERLVSDPPAQMIDLCNAHGIPLILVDKNCSYESLLLDVLGHALDSNLTLLNRFYDVHRQTMMFALEQPTVLQILLHLRSIIHADLTFFDATKDRRTTTNQELSEFTGLRLHILGPDRYRAYSYFDATLQYGSDRTRQATAVRIPSSDDQDYYLVIYHPSSRLAPIDIMAVENVVSLLQMEILKQNAVDRKLFFRNNNLVHDLLHSKYLEISEIREALNTLEIAQHPLYEALLVSITLDNAAEIDRREDVLLMMRRRLKMIYPDIAYFESNDRITFLHNFKNEAGRIEPSVVQSVLQEVGGIPAMPRFSYLAALSGSGANTVLPTLNKQVLDIHRFFDSARYRNTCLRYDDLGIYKILMQATDARDLLQYVDPRVATLRHGNIDLFTTAVALCDNSLNYQETARQLYVHPKTIRYRANRLQKLSGLDLHNADDRLQIMVGNSIFQLIESGD